jgi:hypothetical protein
VLDFTSDWNLSILRFTVRFEIALRSVHGETDPYRARLSWRFETGRCRGAFCESPANCQAFERVVLYHVAESILLSRDASTAQGSTGVPDMLQKRCFRVPGGGSTERQFLLRCDAAGRYTDRYTLGST